MKFCSAVLMKSYVGLWVPATGGDKSFCNVEKIMALYNAFSRNFENTLPTLKHLNFVQKSLVL